MNDRPKDAPAETPMERALRLKKAKLQAKPKPPGKGESRRDLTAGPAGASKPWMKKG